MCNPWHQESRLLRDGKDLSGHVLICQSKEDCSQAVQQKAMSRLWPSRVPISARFFFFFNYLFIYFWLHWIFVAFSSCGEWGLLIAVASLEEHRL